MKKIVKYEDNSGLAWDTEKEALMSDAKLTLRHFMDDYSEYGTGGFPVEEWIEEIKKKPSIIDALLYALEIDFTEIQAKQLIENYNKDKK